MHRSIRPPIALAALALLLVSSAAIAAEGTPAPSSSVGSLVPETHAPLEGWRWSLREYRAEDGGLAGAADGGWLAFADGAITGSSGCNDLTGSYVRDGDALAVSGLAPTEAGCLDGDLAPQEMALLARLPEVTAFAFDDAELWLVDAAGGRHLGFVSMVGPDWAPMYAGDEPTPAGLVTVRFGTWNVSGQGPCNDFAGPVLVDGAGIAIGPIETTGRECPDLALEAQLLDELGRARTFAFEAGDLVLFDETGAPIRAFAGTQGDD